MAGTLQSRDIIKKIIINTTIFWIVATTVVRVYFKAFKVYPLIKTAQTHASVTTTHTETIR